MGCSENHYLSIFQVLDGDADLYNYSKNVVLLLFSIFLSQESFSDFHLAFPTIITLTKQVRELMQGFFQLLSISVSFTYHEPWEITTGSVWGHISLKV